MMLGSWHGACRGVCTYLIKIKILLGYRARNPKIKLLTTLTFGLLCGIIVHIVKKG